MPNSKRKELTGRDAVGKTAIVGIKNSETNKVTAKVVKSTDKETLQGFVEDNTTKETTVYTDEAKAYKGMNRPHESVKHSVSQYVNGMAHTNGIESYWSLLKKGFHGTFHHFSPKHMDRYVHKFTTRYNLRGSDTIVMMGDTVGMMVGKRLTYKQLVLVVEPYLINIQQNIINNTPINFVDIYLSVFYLVP